MLSDVGFGGGFGGCGFDTGGGSAGLQLALFGDACESLVSEVYLLLGFKWGGGKSRLW